MRWGDLFRYVATHRALPCNDAAPGYRFDGLTISIERRHAQRCTRPTGHGGAHADGISTWKGER